MAQSLRTENENFTDGGLGCKERNGLERQNGDELDAEEISRYVCSEETHLVLFKDFCTFSYCGHFGILFVEMHFRDCT